MTGFMATLMYATLPFAGNFLGGLIAEFTSVSKKKLSWALHAAAGILIAVVAIELMPRGLNPHQPWIVLLAFAAGGLFSVGADKFFDRWQQSKEEKRSESGAIPWPIYFAVCMDLFSDGLMIGAGSTIGAQLALLLALGQVAGDLPEGYATIASFKGRNVDRKKRFLAAIAFAIPLFIGATVGYFLVKGQPDIVKYAFLSFTGAILLKAAVEDIMM